MKGCSKLYINGCSFTKGHELTYTQTWPYLIAQQLELDLYNSSANANSMDTIITTSILQLSKFNPAETVVIIGLTWATRVGIMINNIMANVTLGDVEYDHSNWNHRIFGDRCSFPFELENVQQVRKEFEDSVLENNVDFYEPVLKASSALLRTQITYDTNYQRTLNVKFLLNLINLQNFLKVNKFKYLFIDFQNLDEEYKHKDELVLLNQIDREKVVYIDGNSYIKEHSHPTADACEYITKQIISRL